MTTTKNKLRLKDKFPARLLQFFKCRIYGFSGNILTFKLCLKKGQALEETLSISGCFAIEYVQQLANKQGCIKLLKT